MGGFPQEKDFAEGECMHHKMQVKQKTMCK